jgi:hypothetical protein
MFAARRGDSQISAGGAPETHGRIERARRRVFDSLDSFREFQAPSVSSGGATGDRERDGFPGLSVDI